MPSPTLTRRALLAGAGTVVASTALVVPVVEAVQHQSDMTLAERIDHHIARLHEALAELEAEGFGPVRATVGSDHGAIVERLAGSPFQRGVPPTLWRIERPATHA